MNPRQNEKDHEIEKLSDRIDELEKNDGKIATELAIISTKLDYIEGLILERPSRVEFKSSADLTQRDLDSIRAKAKDFGQISASQKKFAMIGAITASFIAVAITIGGLLVKFWSIIFH